MLTYATLRNNIPQVIEKNIVPMRVADRHDYVPLAGQFFEKDLMQRCISGWRVENDRERIISLSDSGIPVSIGPDLVQVTEIEGRRPFEFCHLLTDVF